MILHSIRCVLPEAFGSPASSDFSEMFRLTSLSLKTSSAALARSSVSAWIVTAFSPAGVICAPVPRKSNRVDSSLAAWFSALSSSWWSTLLTMSNEGSATSPLLSVTPVPACHGTRLHTGDVVPRSLLALPRRGAAAPLSGGLPERPMGADCKSVAKATKVRILHPPQSVRSAPDLGNPESGPILDRLTPTRWIPLSLTVRGHIRGKLRVGPGANLSEGGGAGRV